MAFVARPKIDTPRRLSVHRIAGNIGAEIRGIRLGTTLDPDILNTLQDLLVKHKVLFFRGQAHIDDQRQEQIASLFGDLLPHPTMPAHAGSQYILEFNGDEGGRANSWHTDATFLPDYPKAGFLRAVVVPSVGGDTVWANTATAYESLPSSLKSSIDTLWAIHCNVRDYSTDDVVLAEHIRRFTSAVFAAEHPLVRLHPVSGERSLVLGHFLRSIVGLAAKETQELYAELQMAIESLENTVRWRWRPRDVVLWDNRATQHYAIDDYHTQRRIVRRVSLRGDTPIAIDGRLSKAVTLAPPP
jgi:alpha-ketoglutarate-dependent sulfate ester dioxygenase